MFTSSQSHPDNADEGGDIDFDNGGYIDFKVGDLYLTNNAEIYARTWGSGQGGRFDTRQPSESILTATPVEAFGFLDSNIAPFSVEGLGEIAETNDNLTGLRVLDRKTLSLIGGEIEIGMGTFFKTITIDDEGNKSNGINSLPSISAPYGRINLAAVASQGEVKLGGDFVDMSSFRQLADIY